MATGSKRGTTYGLTVVGGNIREAGQLAAAADAAGLDSVWAGEFSFTSATVNLAVLAQATTHCAIGSSIMYAAGRSPMVLAAEARDLDELSEGRLILGLGTGTQRMLTDWHGVPDAGAPATRLEELVPLLRRLWRLHEGPVEYEGRFHRIRISPVPGQPAPLRTDIPIYTSGVQLRMIEAAGRVADGLLGHPLFGVEYVRESVRPAIAKGAAVTGRDPSDVALTSMVITSVHDDAARARREAAQQIAFYASVRSYEPLLDASGFAVEGAGCREAFRQGDLVAMTKAVTDPMIDALSVAGTRAEVVEQLRRYDGVLDRVQLYSPSIGLDRSRVEENIASLVELAGDLRTEHATLGEGSRDD